MKIYTKKGDTGETSLIGGTRVPKYHIRIEAYGTVDELNSWIGLLSTEQALIPHKEILKHIQDLLFNTGSLLAADPVASKMKLPGIEESDILVLEKSMDEMELELPELKNFILPGGHPASAMAHVGRCICRRAERLVSELNATQKVDPLILKFLNRLSDWLFVLARDITQRMGSTEITWTSGR